MRVTQEKRLRNFWYCVMPVSKLSEGPKPFELLGEKLALWLDETGNPHAVRDRCLHRSAALSSGRVENGNIVCPYHGWAYSGSGACALIPQGQGKAPGSYAVRSYHCAARYGHVWVALEDPVFGIPEIPEGSDPAYRQIDEFDEEWLCAPLRLMENAFDNAHLAFVHQNTIGSGDPAPAENTIETRDDGFITRVEAVVGNPAHMRGAIGIDAEKTLRSTANQFFLPFFRVGRITYPNGLVNIHCTAATPMGEGRTQRLQWVLRNDTEADVPQESVIAFDREVSDEDQWILETTDPDVPLDNSEGIEFSMKSDQPGLLMRRMLRDSLNRVGAPTETAETKEAQ